MVVACNSSSFYSYIANLTSSYVNRSNEASMVSTSIFILLLTGIFFNINLLRRLSDLSAVLNPSVQRFLSSALSIFIPVMSYLFSEAKNSDPEYADLQASGLKPDLPRRAGVILLWMLLVELLRNNVEEIRMRGYETSGLIQRAGRVVWLGSLVFFNVRSPGRKAIFGGLWILCASKLVQRVAYTETGKRSYLHNKNSRLIASHMSRVLTRDPPEQVEVEPCNTCHDGTDRHSAIVHSDAQGKMEPDLLERCEYTVMEEDMLVKEATAHGYELGESDSSTVSWVGDVWTKLLHGGADLLKKCKCIDKDHKITPGADDSTSSIVKVDDVWTKLPFEGKAYERLKRLCLSFALFKLLRRRFEHRGEMSVEEAHDCRGLIFEGLYKCIQEQAAEERAAKERATEMSVEEAHDCRGLIFKGLYKCNSGAGIAATPLSLTAEEQEAEQQAAKEQAAKEQAAEAVFQVINDEVNFLCEYYHSIVPVVLASPFFLLSNYLLLPVVLFGLWLMTIVLCGNGDLMYAFRSMRTDNYTINFGIGRLTMCLIGQVTKSPQAFFSMVDLSITSLLFLIFLYEEVWEFFLFVLSNWFLISLLCNYISKPKWCSSFALRCIVWVRGKMRHSRKLRFKQFCALNLRRPLIFVMPGCCMLSLSTVQSVPVPKKVKHSIVEYLMTKHDDLSGGKSALEKHNMDLFPPRGLSWAFESESVAEVILTWHIATSLLQVKLPLSGKKKASSDVATRFSNYCAYIATSLLQVKRPPSDKEEASSAVVATSLSQYCAYLVVFHPELLPDNKDKTEDVFVAMKQELRSSLGFVDYYLSGRDARADKILETAQAQKCWTENKVVKNGATLAKVLIESANTETAADGEVWKMLADVWTELMVYVAPSSDEVHVKGHESLLVKGGEFVTLLWALTTHTGFSRPPTTKPTASH